MRISDWSSDVCSSDLAGERAAKPREIARREIGHGQEIVAERDGLGVLRVGIAGHDGVDMPAGKGEGRRAELVERIDRKRDVEGKSVSIRVNLGGRRIHKKKKKSS